MLNDTTPTGVRPLPGLGLRAAALAAVLAGASVALPAWAQTPIGWTGNGSAAAWSDARNWTALRPPVDGETAVFAGSPSFADNAVDLSVALHSLAFTANAARSPSASPATRPTCCRSAGTGVQNLTSGSGPIRQALYAEAGTVGGTILSPTPPASTSARPSCTGRSTSSPAAALRTAPPAATSCSRTAASTGSTTFNSLRAEGASANGAAGGEVAFRGNAVATVFTTIAVGGGSTAGAGRRPRQLRRRRAHGRQPRRAGPGEAGGLGGRAVSAATPSPVSRRRSRTSAATASAAARPRARPFATARCSPARSPMAPATAPAPAAASSSSATARRSTAPGPTRRSA